MIEKLLLDLALRFVLRQIAQFERATDWDAIDADLQERARRLLPGEWFDAEGAAFAHTVVAAVRGVLGRADALERILGAVAEKRWDDALKELKELLKSVWAPAVLKGFAETGKPKVPHLQLVKALDVEQPAPKARAKGSKGSDVA